MGKRGNTRNHTQREQDRAKVAELYCKGWTQAEIAAEIGVTQPMVSYDLKILHQRWHAAAMEHIDTQKARELAKIDRLEREYWGAWEASKLLKETTTTEQENSTTNTRMKAQVRKEARDGDPRYLEGVRWCIDQRMKLLGTYAPTRLQHQGDPDSPVQVDTTHKFDLSGLTDEQLAILARALGG